MEIAIQKNKMKTIIRNARLINEDRITEGDLLISGDRIERTGGIISTPAMHEIDAAGMFLLPGLIDDQVHFREPGLTHKADIQSESRAAVAGGITSFMEMPNTQPGAVTVELLEDKYNIAARKSIANYSFFMGTTNTNLEEVLRIDNHKVCGVKIFMGSSTGNMLVDDIKAIEALFARCGKIIAVHCESDPMISSNLLQMKKEFGEQITARMHPHIRSREACFSSSSLAVDLAGKHGNRLHVLHISTADELALFSSDTPLIDKRITAEACVHHLWFTEEDYNEKGNFIKWNPAVKSKTDRNAIQQAVISGKIDILATDHAPHTLQEKEQPYLNAPSGGPLVQHALQAHFDLCAQGIFTPEKIVRRACHAPADLFGIENRGYLREGYFADLVLFDPSRPYTVDRNNLLYKCGWSPFEGHTFTGSVAATFVNGKQVYDGSSVVSSENGMRLTFNR